MKSGNIFYQIGLVLLLTATAYLLYQNKYNKQEGPTSISENVKEPTTLDIILQRKSVRHFTGDTIAKEDLIKIIKAGMAAPTARNMQPWDFIIITDRAILDGLNEGLPYAKMIEQSGAAIIVCGNLQKALDGEASQYWIQDCSAATQNILLAIESLNLGGVWTGVYPNTDRVNFVKDFCNLPEHIIPLNVIPVGVPTGEDKPKDKFKEENIHWEVF